MKKQIRTHETELAVIGAGISGCAATLFALNRGIKVTQVGNTGALAFTSGYFDLLGVDQGKIIQDPWSALEQLRETQPEHPYARLSNQIVNDAFSEFVGALNEMGLNYTLPAKVNQTALLPTGAVKPTYCIPQTMSQGCKAMADGAKTLIIDFEGLQGFSGQEIAENLSKHWPRLSVKTLAFPGMESGAALYAEVMARSLEVAETCEALANEIKAVAGDADYIALPAILGIYKPDEVHQDMETRIGLPVFEIPTIPPGVAGIRLRELLEQQLHERGADIVTQYKVKQVKFNEAQVELSYEDHFGLVIIKAQNVLLASGRFLSGGLSANQNEIKETLMNLPIQQPESRDDWYGESYFDPNGHAVNKAGVMVNDNFQVVDSNQQIIDPRLYASGIVLANQDWIRQRSGAGIALASAYQVVKSLVD
jgi:glycerol-3-phosphate dehydrogenase subunit B